jgi:hypothetical protein
MTQRMLAIGQDGTTRLARSRPGGSVSGGSGATFEAQAAGKTGGVGCKTGDRYLLLPQDSISRGLRVA